jgi:hypothetical protein
MARLETLALEGGETPSSLVQRLILAEINRGSEPQMADPMLAEIVGVRLLIVNLFGPLLRGEGPLSKQNFEASANEIKRIKHQVALDIQRQKL